MACVSPNEAYGKQLHEIWYLVLHCIDQTISILERSGIHKYNYWPYAASDHSVPGILNFAEENIPAGSIMTFKIVWNLNWVTSGQLIYDIRYSCPGV